MDDDDKIGSEAERWRSRLEINRELDRLREDIDKLKAPISVRVNFSDAGHPDRILVAFQEAMARASSANDICARPGCESPRKYNIHDPARGGHVFVEQPPATPEPPQPDRRIISSFGCPFCSWRHPRTMMDIVVPALAGEGLVAIFTMRNGDPVRTTMMLERTSGKATGTAAVLQQSTHDCLRNTPPSE